MHTTAAPTAHDETPTVPTGGPVPAGAAVPARPARPLRPARPSRPALPAAGPAWFPSVMGTGILATLLGLHAPGLPTGARTPVASVALALATLAWALLLGLAGAFALRCARHPGVLVASLRDPAQSPMWGTVSMGVLAVGSATVTVVPTEFPGVSGPAFAVDVALWCVGTVLGLYTAVDFAVGLRVRALGRPTPVWGLPVVAPMVSATTGCALVDHLSGPGAQLLLLVALVSFVGMSLVLGGVVFALAYHHHWAREPLSLALTPSLWIPLGIVGQSTAAVQSIAARSVPLVVPGAQDAVRTLALGYALVVLGVVGAALGGYAVLATARGFARRMPFTPGWWAMTFPLGTCALGAHLAGGLHGSTGWGAVGGILTIALVGTWTLCAVATVRATLGAGVTRSGGRSSDTP